MQPSSISQVFSVSVGVFANRVNEDVESGRHNRAADTPTFFINEMRHDDTYTLGYCYQRLGWHTPTVRQIPKPFGSCSCTWHWGIVKKTASLLVESLTIEDSMDVIRNYWGLLPTCQRRGNRLEYTHIVPDAGLLARSA
jgi:hypothetical protein